MSGHIADDTLQDWLDGLLGPVERTAVEAHVATCDSCAREAELLRALIDDLHALPRGMPPRRDLHEGIAQRIDGPVPGARGGTLRRAAAITLVAGGAVATALSLRTEPAEPTPAGDFRSTHAGYARAAEELEDALRTHPGSLEPEAVAALERSLATIDAALAEAGEALAKDPQSELLNELVLVGYERRLDVLRRAADPSSP